MRMLTTIADESRAHRFGDYLLTRNIDATVESATSGGWVVWVVDDDDIPQAQDELRAFEQDPNHARYNNAQRDAERVRARREQEQQRLAKNYVDVRTNWSKVASRRVPVTGVLIGGSILVALLTAAMMGEGLPAAAWWLMFSPSQEQMGFGAILSGQIWRLLTPIFLHFGILHLFFNMLWTADLGRQIERQRGSGRLAALVVVAAVVSNVLEHLFEFGFDVPGVIRFAPGISFVNGEPALSLAGGMSGVVYALFGFVWMRGRYAPQQGMGVSQQTVMILMIWLVICLIGWLNIANMAHFSGLAVGLIAGWAPLQWRRWRRSR